MSPGNARCIDSRGHRRSPWAPIAAAAVALVVPIAIGFAQPGDHASVDGPVMARAAGGDQSIRAFRIAVPQEALDDLQRRLAATPWPERENVTDRSKGVKLATVKAPAGYWQAGYDWRKVKAKWNALPQFVTTIAGLDIHFIPVRSKYANALPVILTHGWPGSIVEEMKIVT